MNRLGFLKMMEYLWERINVISIVAVLGMIGAIWVSFARWVGDRGRLKNLEDDRDKMREDFEKHREDNAENYNRVFEKIHSSNQAVIDKVDALTMYLLHSKITLKEKNNENEEGTV